MRQRRRIEIYFVLYLAALMLLLSDSPKREHELASAAVRNLLASTFTLYPERTTLLCRAVVSDSTLAFLHFDSTNTIVPAGMVDSVSYSITAADESSGERLTLDQTGIARNGNFEFAAEQVGTILRFRWNVVRPEPKARLFRITVAARARPVLPTNLPPDQRQHLASLLANDNTLLAHQTVFLVGYIPERPAVQQSQSAADSAVEARLRALIAEGLGRAPAATFAVVPQFPTVRTLPFLQWENRLVIYGADPRRDLAKPPQISGIPSAFVLLEGNTIVVRGIANQAGTAQARITLTRRDGVEATATFAVITQAVAAPQAPSVMHPGIEYSFAPNLPELSGAEVRALLRDDRGVIRASSNGEPFTFTPTRADTGHTFYFERYAGSERIGQVLAIPCEMFPPPEILSIQRQGERNFVVRCRGYGLSSDSKSRLRLECEPPTAARVQELYGEYVYDAQSYARIQVFVVSLQANAVSIRAINDYAQRSEERLLQVR